MSSCKRQSSHNSDELSTDTALLKKDMQSVRQRLFTYFENGGCLPKLDTMNATPTDIYRVTWAFVKSGYIFSKSKKHAIIYYQDDKHTSFYVFLLQQKRWIPIFQDTLVPYSFSPEVADLNGDGVKDIIVPINTDNRDKKYWLWLMHEDGNMMHKVIDFEDLPNPQTTDKQNLFYSHGYYNGYRFELYKFVGQGVKMLKGLEITWLYDSPSPDSQILVSYWVSGDYTARQVFTPPEGIKSAIPVGYDDLFAIWEQERKK